MIDRMVTIYKRNDGVIYLHHHQRSSMGVYLACPPFIKIQPSEVQCLPQAINELLALEPETVAHPKTFNQLDPLFGIAGSRNWKEFAKGTLCFHVGFEKGELKLIRTRKDGAGFADLPDPVSLGRLVDLDVLLSAAPDLK